MAAQASLTRIVNRAAVHLGTSKRISSIDEDSPLANAAKAVLDFARDELLAAHPWNFALKRADLPASGDYTPRGAAFGYELPPDCLRWLPWPHGASQFRFAEREGNLLLSDAEAPLPIRYIARIENPALWSPGFTAALAAQLAMEMGAQITGADSLDQKLVRRLERAIAAGKRQDGLETGFRGRGQARMSSWLTARGDHADREGGLPWGAPIV